MTWQSWIASWLQYGPLSPRRAMIRILHLSDLHFGASHHFPMTRHDAGTHRFADAIFSALESHNSVDPIDAIVISGDFLDKQQVEDRVHAEQNLKELLVKLNVSADRLLCVPGNHDLTWDRQFLDNSPYAKFRFYDDLMERVGATASQRSNLPRVEIIQGQSGDKPVALCLLSSCELESESMAGFGRVTERQLDDLK